MVALRPDTMNQGTGGPPITLEEVVKRSALSPDARHTRFAGLALWLTATAMMMGSVRADLQESQPARATDESPDPTGDTSDEALDDIDLLDLEVPIVVTAARHEQKLSDVPYALSVITAEDIRRTGARSVPDALRLIPGVDVADLAFATSAVAPRGFHGFIANQVLVLVDGRQIFDSLFGGTLWGSWPFLLEDIDRIEVIRGPGGVTWGANAVNGVINIITKDPGDQLGLTLTTSGGSTGWAHQYVGYAAREGNLRLRWSGEYESSDGFDRGGSILRKLDDEYRVGRSTLHAVWEQESGDTLTLSLGSAVVDGAYPPSPLAGMGMRRNSGSQATFILANWSRQLAPDDHLELTAYVNDFQASPGLPQVDYRYQQIALLLGHTYKPSDDHTLTWGLDMRVDLLDATNADPYMLTRGSTSTAIAGMYLQDEWRFAPKWMLSLGGRIDYESYGGFQPSARIALSHELADHALVYGAVSRAFHMPAAGGRFLNIPMVNGIAHVTANQDTDPTTVIAYELGYRGRLFDRIDTSVNLFWHDYDEVTTLGPELGPPGILRLDYSNRGGNVALYGLEIEAKVPVTSRLTLSGHYTYQQLNWDVAAPFTERDYMTPPQHKFMLAARYDITDDLHLSSNLYFVDAVKSPNPSNPFVPLRIGSYCRLDVRAEQEFWNDQASFAIGARNLIDPHHHEGASLFLNAAETQRMVYAELRVAIPN